MKRPEGFDRAPQPPARRGAGASAERKRRAAPAPERHSEATAHSPTARPTTARPESTQRETERRESAPTERVAPSRAAAADRPKSSASRRRTARAEIRAAARARRREEKAEVRRFTAATRRRRTVALSALGVVAAAVGLVAFAVFSPLLALREIVIAGTERLDPDAIVSALEPEIGTPLALLDESRIADNLSEFTLIRSFVIELIPPNTMRVEIDEREPIGVVVSDSVFQLVDPAGIVIEETLERPDGVPILDLPRGDDGTVRTAVSEVLLALPADVLARVDRITATTRDDVSFTLRDSEQSVVWGSAESSDRKAVILAALLTQWGDSGAGEYDVSATGSAVFREG